MSKLLNNWSTHKIIHKDKIINYDLLLSRNLISNLTGTDYYYLNEPVDTVEYEIYKHNNEQMTDEMNIEDCNIEIKKFIKDLHVYNKLKDIGQALVNKIAERKNTTSKEILREMEYDL